MPGWIIISTGKQAERGHRFRCYPTVLNAAIILRLCRTSTTLFTTVSYACFVPASRFFRALGYGEYRASATAHDHGKVIALKMQTGSRSPFYFLPEQPNQWQLGYAVNHVGKIMDGRLFRIERPQRKWQNGENSTEQQVPADRPG